MDVLPVGAQASHGRHCSIESSLLSKGLLKKVSIGSHSVPKLGCLRESDWLAPHCAVQRGVHVLRGQALSLLGE
jgi:hypothetical protein